MFNARIAVALAACLAVAPLAHAKKPTLTTTLHSSDGSKVGTATFTQTKKALRIHIAVHDLPFGEHAVHIHQFARCDAPDFKSAGGHFNPDGKQHGMNNPMGHHAGDMPANLSVGEDHTGVADFTVNYLSLDPYSPHSIVANGGTSIMIHEHADDMMTDPTGNAGNRIACGVIMQ